MAAATTQILTEHHDRSLRNGWASPVWHPPDCQCAQFALGASMASDRDGELAAAGLYSEPGGYGTLDVPLPATWTRDDE